MISTRSASSHGDSHLIVPSRTPGSHPGVIRFIILLILYAINVMVLDEMFPFILTLPAFLLISYNAYRSREKYLTPHDMFWFCVFLFFVIGPCQSIRNGMIGVTSDGFAGGVTQLTYESFHFITAMLIVTLFLIGFSFCYRRKPKILSGHTNIIIPPYWLLCLNIVSFVAFVVFSGGIGNVLAARLEKVAEERSVFALPMLTLQIITTCVIAASCWNNEKYRWSRLVYLMPAVILLSVSQNPFNAARFFLVASWVPVFLSIVRGRLPTSMFYGGSLFAIIVIFPVLSVTTRFGVSGLTDFSAMISASSFFDLPFIDIFDTLVHTVWLMENRSWYLGDNIIAIGLFFIPRIFWPGKPVVGGLIVGEELHYWKMVGTDNLSFFIGGDFYMDFGLLGVAVGGLLCGYIFYRMCWVDIGVFYGQRLFQYVLIGSLPILVRGPVGAVAAMFVCQVGTLMLLHVLWRYMIQRGASRAAPRTNVFRPSGGMAGADGRLGA